MNSASSRRRGCHGVTSMEEESACTVESFFKNESKFYNDARTYWSQVEPTVNGMLGGFGTISNTDIQGSELFLKKLFALKNGPHRTRAIDCGAGIGRITKNLLVKYFEKVDLVEQNPKFVEAAKRMLGFEKNMGSFFNVGLQNFVPKEKFYDVIWCQWVLGHLTDDHLVRFLKHCLNGLKNNGMIIVKENISSSDIIVDEEDSSVTRTEDIYLKLFNKAGLDVVRHCKQKHFPKELFIVKIYALRPRCILQKGGCGDCIITNPKNVEPHQTVEMHSELNSNADGLS